MNACADGWKDARLIEVEVHPEAETEYEIALAWYLERSPQAAERFEKAFDEGVVQIRRNPTIFPFCDSTHRFVLLRCYPFKLVYRFDGKTARVISVSHSKRHQDHWTGRV